MKKEEEEEKWEDEILGILWIHLNMTHIRRGSGNFACFVTKNKAREFLCLSLFLPLTLPREMQIEESTLLHITPRVQRLLYLPLRHSSVTRRVASFMC